MVAINQYVHESGAYPMLDTLVPDLQPFTRSLWPADNYDYSHSSGPGKYLGPGTGIYACPAYNRMQGSFLSDPPRLFVIDGSYGYNQSGSFGGGLGASGARRVLSPTLEQQVVAPSDMIGMGDAIIVLPATPPVTGVVQLDFPFRYPDHYIGVMYGAPAYNAAVQAMKQRHGGRWNMGFAMLTLRLCGPPNYSTSLIP